MTKEYLQAVARTTLVSQVSKMDTLPSTGTEKGKLLLGSLRRWLQLNLVFLAFHWELVRLLDLFGSFLGPKWSKKRLTTRSIPDSKSTNPKAQVFGGWDFCTWCSLAVDTPHTSAGPEELGHSCQLHFELSRTNWVFISLTHKARIMLLFHIHYGYNLKAWRDDNPWSLKHIASVNCWPHFNT